MTLGDQSAIDILDIINDDPIPFQFKGREYTGTASGLLTVKTLEIGGFEERPELTIVVNLKDKDGGKVFGQDPPKVGEKITVRGVEYRIDSTEPPSTEEEMKITLRSKHI